MDLYEFFLSPNVNQRGFWTLVQAIQNDSLAMETSSIDPFGVLSDGCKGVSVCERMYITEELRNGWASVRAGRSRS